MACNCSSLEELQTMCSCNLEKDITTQLSVRDVMIPTINESYSATARRVKFLRLLNSWARTIITGSICTNTHLYKYNKSTSIVWSAQFHILASNATTHEALAPRHIESCTTWAQSFWDDRQDIDDRFLYWSFSSSIRLLMFCKIEVYINPWY